MASAFDQTMEMDPPRKTGVMDEPKVIINCNALSCANFTRENARLRGETIGKATKEMSFTAGEKMPLGTFPGRPTYKFPTGNYVTFMPAEKILEAATEHFKKEVEQVKSREDRVKRRNAARE